MKKKEVAIAGLMISRAAALHIVHTMKVKSLIAFSALVVNCEQVMSKTDTKKPWLKLGIYRKRAEDRILTTLKKTKSTGLVSTYWQVLLKLADEEFFRSPTSNTNC